MKKSVTSASVLFFILGIPLLVSCIVVDTLTDLTVGATTSHTVSSTTTNAGTIATIEGEFPPGFDVSGATLGAVSGISAGTISVVGQVVIYTVTTPVFVPSGTAISIELTSIVNATTVGNYTVTATSKNGVGAIIDGPTTSLSFTLIPAAEIYLLIEIGSVIGAINTLFVILITGFVGAYLARLEGMHTLLKIKTVIDDF